MAHVDLLELKVALILAVDHEDPVMIERAHHWVMAEFAGSFFHATEMLTGVRTNWNEDAH